MCLCGCVLGDLDLRGWYPLTPATCLLLLRSLLTPVARF